MKSDEELELEGYNACQYCPELRIDYEELKAKFPYIDIALLLKPVQPQDVLWHTLETPK